MRILQKTTCATQLEHLYEKQKRQLYCMFVPCLFELIFQSRYAFSPQDTDFTSSYPGPSMNRRGGYNDFSGGGGGGGGSAMGSMNNMVNAASTNSLNCGGGGGGDGHGGGSNGTNLIVNYLPQDMTDRELYALFRTIGPINTCRIMRDYKVSGNKYKLELLHT